ncbi:TadE/TadG family type IV pilus assembly protein [Pararhizobium haloflavum]|uniref:TadE/TadG family type IV pilus assembly protein n=1 Tax=Pararhizobium haloflavum TaxID=2037914 RepID=UPI000C18B231|nr:TadE/TadG family type IV pilus assembly protein [Pararhizobium haloflavum]
MNATMGKGRSARARSPADLVARFRRSQDGVAAIEFAMLAIPFFLLLFAIIESCVAYAAEQVLDNAVDTLGRQLRTGQITFDDPARSSYMDEAAFRDAFCAEIEIMLDCSEDRLYLDVRGFQNFSQIPVAIPRVGDRPYGDLDRTEFDFAPLGSGKINMVRAYYRWQIITDLIRPHITNIRPADGSMPTDYLIVGTAAFQNEEYGNAVAAAGS